MAGGYPPPGSNPQYDRQPQTGYSSGGQPGYPPQGQGGYPPQPQGGYPPGQPGYPPQGMYPPHGQMGYGAPLVADPNAPYGIDPKTGIPFSDKQKMVAGLLQICLGGFAVGRFYTGHTGMAIAQLAVTWLTCGLGVFWPIIDGVMILANGGTDAQGRPLREN